MSAKIKDIVNKKYGRLTVLSLADGRDKSGATLWNCQCDCGNLTIVSKGKLVSGATLSCGCYKKETSRSIMQKIGGGNRLSSGESSLNSLYQKYKQSANLRGHIFDIDKKDFQELISKDCYYCGESPLATYKVQGGIGEVIYNGLDRLNNKVGYIKDNVVPCCKFCNYAKRNNDVSFFLEKIRAIYSNFSRKEPNQMWSL